MVRAAVAVVAEIAVAVVAAVVVGGVEVEVRAEVEVEIAMGRGAKGSEAEKLLLAWLEEQGWVAHRAARAGFIRLPNGKGFCRSHDIFGCIDLLAIKTDATWAIQVTTAAGKTARRRKIETVTAWPTSWRVSLVSQETIENPADRRRAMRFWKIQDYDANAPLKWGKPTAIFFEKA